MSDYFPCGDGHCPKCGRWVGDDPCPACDVALNYGEVWKEIRDAQRLVEEVHIACTPAWAEARRLEVKPEDLDPTKHGSPYMIGISVYVTDDVTDPRGYEVRPGLRPAVTYACDGCGERVTPPERLRHELAEGDELHVACSTEDCEGRFICLRG